MKEQFQKKIAKEIYFEWERITIKNGHKAGLNFLKNLETFLENFFEEIVKFIQIFLINKR